MVGGSLRVLPASSTTKTGRHDIAGILLKVALKHQKSNQNLCVYQALLYYIRLILFSWFTNLAYMYYFVYSPVGTSGYRNMVNLLGVKS